MSAAAEPLKAPFPYAGGKSRVADIVWSRFGNVDNFIEPFMGSLAVLLRRPADHFRNGYRVETCNDANHYVTNFWRAVKHAPDAVAEWADWPVSEADLHARHKWLVRSPYAAAWRAKMADDPDHFDPKIAGWWAWGACCWIGGAWCHDGTAGKRQLPGPNADGRGYGLTRGDSANVAQVPHMDGTGRGQTAAGAGSDHKRKKPALGQECATGGVGIHGVGSAQIPHMSNAGQGVYALPGEGRPQLTDAYDIGRGVNSGGHLSQQKPQLGAFGGQMAGAGVLNPNGGASAKRPNYSDDGIGVVGMPMLGTCDARRAWLVDWFRRLSDRLRLVRPCYGHWSRVCDSDSTLTRLGTTGVFLDPPYPTRRADTGKKSRSAGLYATDKGSDLNALRDEVLAWCEKWGDDPQIRVGLCCYEGDGYEGLTARGWTLVEWEASGGYGNQRKGGGKAANAKRERIYFSPACLNPDGPTLFDCLVEEASAA